MEKLRIWLLASIFLGTFASAHAAGISCDAAKTRIDHVICNSKVLVEADSELDIAYRQTLNTAADQTALIQSQRAWLKQRNACGDGTCVAKAYADRTVALKQVKHAGWATYRDPALGVSFEYLTNRQVKQPCPTREDERCVALVGKGMGSSNYFIAFKLVNGPLEQVARKEAGFIQKDGKWVTDFGPSTPVDVERFSGNGWQGMRATVVCGVSDSETGFHAAAGECFWAVMSNGKRSVVVDTQGLIGNGPNTQRSVESFSFVP